MQIVLYYYYYYYYYSALQCPALKVCTTIYQLRFKNAGAVSQNLKSIIVYIVHVHNNESKSIITIAIAHA